MRELSYSERVGMADKIAKKVLSDYSKMSITPAFVVKAMVKDVEEFKYLKVDKQLLELTEALLSSTLTTEQIKAIKKKLGL
jgi:hypothetical protein